MPLLDRRQLLAASLLAPALGALAGRARAADGPRYRIVDLGDLGGGRATACGLNDEGLVVGESTRQPGDHHGVAFLWERGRMRGLRMERRSVASRAVAINAHGVVAGFDTANADPSYLQSAWTWSGGARLYCAKPRPRDSTLASAINADGVVAGFLYPSAGVLWRDGQLVDLSAQTGLAVREARGLNDAGEVVGSCQRADGTLAGLRLRGGEATLIEWAGAREVQATAINASGQVCGAYLPVGRERPRAFVWQDGIAQDLGALGGDGAASQALAINAAGVVVGTSGRAREGRPGAYLPRAFVWQGGVMHDLNERLVAGAADWVLRSAVGINAHGQIVGQGRRGGADRAYLALPV